jgi:dephospho-CoA kinase
MTTPIGLTGLAGAGKDTAFGFLREWAEERGVLPGVGASQTR